MASLTAAAVYRARQEWLEAVAVYEAYIEDFEDVGDDRCRQLFEDIRRDDEQHAERLRGELERFIQEGKFR